MNREKQVKDYLDKHCYQKASVRDICRYTGLSEYEVERIVENDSSLEFQFSRDYVKYYEEFDDDSDW